MKNTYILVKVQIKSPVKNLIGGHAGENISLNIEPSKLIRPLNINIKVINDKVNNDKVNNDKVNNDKVNNDKVNNDKVIPLEPSVDIIDNDHYVSFIIMYYDDLRVMRTTPSKQSSVDLSGSRIGFAAMEAAYAATMQPYENSLLDKRRHMISNNVLVYGENKIPSYKIDIEPSFKYKKYIRNKMITEFNYKNKDIKHIKSIGLYGNYHNYIVLLNNKSRLASSYKNILHSTSKDKYVWKTIYEWYKSSTLAISHKEIYEILIKNNMYNKHFTDKLMRNRIEPRDIYRSLVSIL